MYHELVFQNIGNREYDFENVLLSGFRKIGSILFR